MKKHYSIQFVSIVLGILFLASCASTKKLVDSYTGKWKYELETPQGNFNGAMEIKHDGDVFHGSLNSDMGSVDLSDLVIEDGKLTANFEMMGNVIDVSGNFNGDIFDGNMSTSGFDMPFKATREK